MKDVKDLFLALGALFLAAEYAFMAANCLGVALFAGTLALMALVAVRTDQLREESAVRVRRSAGPRTFSLPDMSFASSHTAKPVIRHRAAKAA